MSRSPLLLGALIVLAVTICYLPAMHAGFVWDDDLLLTENQLVKGSGGLPYIWASAASADYTPLTTTAFWLQWRLWGGNAVAYHLVNIALYALAALLLWRLLERLAIPGAWLGAMIFAVHPVNVASVAWIAELKNTLSLPFYLGAIIAFLRFLDTRRLPAYLLALALAVCALLSKASTVVLPLILFLCVWWKARRISARDLVALLPFLAVSAAIAVVTVHFQSRLMDIGYVQAPLPERIARAGRAIWFYLAKDVWPADLCTVYPKWPLDRNYLPLLLAIAFAALLWLGRKRITCAPFFAWAAFVTALLPVLGLLNMSFLDQAYVADWWQQLALPAITALAAAGVAIAWLRAPRFGRVAQPAIAGVVALVLLCFGALTWSGACGYESMETLCRRTIARNPDAWTAHNNLGGALTIQGRNAEAAVEYQEALRLKPNDASAYSNLGIIYGRLHRFEDAIAQYRASLNLDPGNAKTWFNLGNLYRAGHHNPEAIDAYVHAIDNDGAWAAPRYGLGSLLVESGRAREAGYQAEVILKLDPESGSGHYLKARAAAAIGRFDVAASEAQAALDVAIRSGQQGLINQMAAAVAACKAGQQPPNPQP